MGTHHKGTAKEKLALDVFIKLLRASDGVIRRTNRPIRDAGLTESQFGVLETLYHLGPMCQGVLGGKILKSGGNITTVVDNLEKQGLAERKRVPGGDRRYVSVQLTKKGRALIKKVFPKVKDGITREVSVLSQTEQKELCALLKKLGLGADGG